MGKLKKLTWSSFLLGALFVALLFFIVQEAKKEVAKVEKAQAVGRIPASIPRSSDLSGLQGDLLARAGKMKLLGGLTLEQSKDSASVHLGNFVMLNQQQQKDFVCGVYNHITISFEAEGVAVGGEKPSLIVDAPCSVGNDISALTPIEIPISQIKSQNAGNREMVIQQSGGPLHVVSGNSAEAWPKQWSLVDIKMTNDSDASQSLHVTADEVRKNTNKPVLMNW
jgi:hypothetical protein